MIERWIPAARRPGRWPPTWRSGIVEGEERGRALQHLADCPDCRAEVEKYSELADELLLLAPRREAPVGFESRVLSEVLPAPQPKRRRRLAARRSRPRGRGGRGRRDRPRHRRPPTCASPPTTGTPSTRRTGRSSSPTPCGRGTPHVGTVFSYEGSPSWVHIDVDQGHRAGADRRRAGHRRRQPDPAALVPPRSGGWLGRLDPGRSETRLGPAPLRGGRAASRWSRNFSALTRPGAARRPL